MHRNHIIQLLKEYKPSSGELASRERMLDFIQRNPNCFERTLEVGHITASAWLLSKDGSKALLMHHAKLNRWLQLGGHCDGNPDPLATAIREAQEESGIQGIVALSPEIFDIDIHLIPATSREREHYHYDVRFLLQVASDEEVAANSESRELRWIGKDPALLPTQETSVVRLFEKWLQQSPAQAPLPAADPRHYA